MRKVTGRTMTMRLEMIAPASGPMPTTLAGAGANGRREEVRPERGEGDGKPHPRRGAKEEAEKVPLVRRALDVLGATIQRVDEGFGADFGAENASPSAPSGTTGTTGGNGRDHRGEHASEQEP